MRPRLKLFCGEDEGELGIDPPRVTMKVGEFFQIVSEAARFKRTWLRDFEDDDIQIPEDLYDVLSTYWTIRPGA